MPKSVFDAFAAVMRRERSVERLVPYSSLVAPGVVMGRRGSLFATFRCEGMPFETAEDEDLEASSRLLNSFLRGLPSGVAVTVHRIRRPTSDRLGAPAEAGFARDFALRYNDMVGGLRLMSTEYYVTIEARGDAAPPRGLDPAERAAALGEGVAAFENVAAAVERALARFSPTRLVVETVGGRECSSQLSFYNFLLTLEWTPVRVTASPLWRALGAADVFLGPDMLEVSSATGRVYAQGLEIKDFAQSTVPGLLDELLYPDIASVAPYGFVETQVFRVMGKAEARKFLAVRRRQLVASDDPAGTQIAALTEAMDGLVDGAFTLGAYSYGLLVLGGSEAAVRKNTRDAAEKLKKSGVLPVQSGFALGGLYASQLPGNDAESPRAAVISSLNFAHFAPFHNLCRGKRDHNPWGEALLLLRTPTDQPYYFNFHTSPLLEKSEGKKTLGTTTVIGTSGSGKTVFLNTCLAMAQKYRASGTPLTCVFLDKDRGSEIAVRAMGGGYLAVRNGVPTGFNPLALPATEENIQFLVSLVRLLVSMDGRPIAPSDDLRLSRAVRAAMSVPREYRRLALVPQNIVEPGAGEGRENSLPKRLAKWVGDGDLAWVFDNMTDTLDFSRAPLLGVDGTEFLDNPAVRTPVAYYLLHRMEEAIDGRRFIFLMDEFWKWLSDEAFRDFVHNKLKTIRKQNGLGVFATQSPSDVLAGPIARAVVEQSATLVLLPNPRALEEEYVEGFKLTPSEFEVVRSLPESSRLMLVKQGGTSAVCRLDLSGFGKELLVLSGTTDNVALLDRIRSKTGDDPDAWLPVFYAQAAKGGKK